MNESRSARGQTKRRGGRQKERKGTLETHVLVRYNVANFAGWKPVDGAHAHARRAAGLMSNLSCGVDDQNETVLLFAAMISGRHRRLSLPSLRTNCGKRCREWDDSQAGQPLAEPAAWSHAAADPRCSAALMSASGGAGRGGAQTLRSRDGLYASLPRRPLQRGARPRQCGARKASLSRPASSSSLSHRACRRCQLPQPPAPSS